MIRDAVTIEQMESWLEAEIERARQLLVENPLNTRKTLDRALRELRKLSERQK